MLAKVDVDVVVHVLVDVVGFFIVSPIRLQDFAVALQRQKHM